MINRSVPETENKLMILYALSRLGPCTSEQLLQFMAEYGLMDYFTLQLLLYDMADVGQVLRRSHPFGEMLQVTDSGAFTVEEFDRRIPASFRQVIDAEADAWRERFYLEQQAPAEVVGAEGGKAIHLLLLQGERTAMEVRMPVPVNDKATTFLQRRWREIALDAQQLIRHLLSEGRPNGDLPPMPGDAAVQRQEDGSLLLTLRNADGVLTLAVSDEDTACWYARRWQLIGSDVLKAVLELLHLTLMD